MGRRNVHREMLGRLESKTLDAQFKTVIEKGLNCSPFEAEAVLEVVREVYQPYFQEPTSPPLPGVVSVVTVSAEEPAGKPVAQCEKQVVLLKVHRGAEDDRLLQEKGPAGFRRARIPDLCQEALSQGGLLTREDLAYRVFFAGLRTVSRDLSFLREQRPPVPLPLRSTVQDIGPVLTHRVEIVKLALEGKTTTEIRDILRHSPAAIANYLSTFTRCAQLAREGMQVGQIAFLLRRGKGLVCRYLELLETCEADRNRCYHLEELLRTGKVSGEKKRRRRASHGR